MKIVSICIPTHNRFNLLKSLVNTLIREMKGIENKVEICISDNASDDGTETYIKHLKKKYKFIKFKRNKKNLGYDRNVRSAWMMTSSKYGWLMSDDDFVLPGAVRRIVNLLEKYNPDYVFPEYTDSNGQKMIGWEGNLVNSASKKFKQEMIRHLYSAVVFLGHIVSRKVIRKTFPSLPLFGYTYIQVMLFFCAYPDLNRIIVYDTPSIRAGGKGSKTNVKALVDSYENAMDLFYDLYKRKAFSKDDYKLAVEYYFKDFHLGVLVFGIAYSGLEGQVYDDKINMIYSRYKKLVKPSLFFKFIMFMLNHFPMSIQRPLVRFAYVQIYLKLGNLFRHYPMISEIELTRKGKRNNLPPRDFSNFSDV